MSLSCPGRDTRATSGWPSPGGLSSRAEAARLVRGVQVRGFRGLGVHRGPRVCSPQPRDTWGPPCVAEPPLGPWACRLRGRLGRGRGSPHPRLRSSSLASPVSWPRRSRTVLFEETRATENRQSPRRALGPQPWDLGSELPQHDGLFTPTRAADILVS